jgi:uncharacterized protein (DUF2336 family)
VTSRFSKFEEFARLAQQGGVDVKPTLLRVLTDFYVQKPAHTAEEERHFTALAARLIEEVDPQTRMRVAERLMNYPAAPPDVLRQLGVAAPAAAPPAPTAIPATSDEALPMRSGRSGGADTDRIAAAHFSDMFFRAGSDQRKLMLAELATAATMPPLAIASDEAALATQRLEAAALKGRPFEFVREVERVLQVPRSIAEAVIRDTAGEPILVIAKSLSMPIDVLQRVLLLVNPLIGSSVRRVYDLCALYEELTPDAALRLVLLWRHAAAPRPVTYQVAQAPGAAADPRDAGITRIEPPVIDSLKKDRRA